MKIKVLFIVVGCVLGIIPLQAGKTTHISVILDQYVGNEVTLDFVGDRELGMKFLYEAGRAIEYDVELKEVTMLRINGWTRVCLFPGDSINAEITYDGQSYRDVVYTGTPSAVASGNLLHQIRSLRRERRFNDDIPKALVLGNQVQDYHKASLKEWKDEIAMLDGIREQIPEQVYHYLCSEIEGTLLSDLLIYPYAYADVRKMKAEEILPGDYWQVLEFYQMREDDASLSNPSYVALLSPYMEYKLCIQENRQNPAYGLQDLQKEFQNLATFYKGNQRDVALFTLLYRAIVKNQNFETIEKLKKEYSKKYNKKKQYDKLLTQLMK